MGRYAPRRPKISDLSTFGEFFQTLALFGQKCWTYCLFGWKLFFWQLFFRTDLKNFWAPPPLWCKIWPPHQCFFKRPPTREILLARLCLLQGGRKQFQMGGRKKILLRGKKYWGGPGPPFRSKPPKYWGAWAPLAPRLRPPWPPDIKK